MYIFGGYTYIGAEYTIRSDNMRTLIMVMVNEYVLLSKLCHSIRVRILAIAEIDVETHEASNRPETLQETMVTKF